MCDSPIQYGLFELQDSLVENGRFDPEQHSSYKITNKSMTKRSINQLIFLLWYKSVGIMEHRYIYLHTPYDLKNNIIIHIQIEHHAKTAAPFSVNVCWFE